MPPDPAIPPVLVALVPPDAAPPVPLIDPPLPPAGVFEEQAMPRTAGAATTSRNRKRLDIMS